MSKIAILLGASGLIGSHLLKLLLEGNSFKEVIVFVRRPLNIKHEKLTEVVTDFTDLSTLKEHLKGNVIFSCLGSTKRKTPNLEDYRKIDHDIPLQIATLASQNGISQFHLISALGANPKSSNFYSKMKGVTEEELKAIAIPAIHIYQPSLLRGNRKEKRFLENLALTVTAVLDPLLLGFLRKYRSIRIETVAQAMYNQSLKAQRGIFTYPSDKIKELA